jgi:predicted TIM-barrel fold metal-dependent hydrolase
MHPDYEDVEGELDRIRAAGLRGVKLHPDFQHFCLDDEKAIAMFQAMADRNMPAIIHCLRAIISRVPITIVM